MTRKKAAPVPEAHVPSRAAAMHLLGYPGKRQAVLNTIAMEASQAVPDFAASLEAAIVEGTWRLIACRWQAQAKVNAAAYAYAVSDEDDEDAADDALRQAEVRALGLDLALDVAAEGIGLDPDALRDVAGIARHDPMTEAVPDRDDVAAIVSSMAVWFGEQGSTDSDIEPMLAAPPGLMNRAWIQPGQGAGPQTSRDWSKASIQTRQALLDVIRIADAEIAGRADDDAELDDLRARSKVSLADAERLALLDGMRPPSPVDAPLRSHDDWRAVLVEQGWGMSG